MLNGICVKYLVKHTAQVQNDTAKVSVRKANWDKAVNSLPPAPQYALQNSDAGAQNVLSLTVNNNFPNNMTSVPLIYKQRVLPYYSVLVRLEITRFPISVTPLLRKPIQQCHRSQ